LLITFQGVLPGWEFESTAAPEKWKEQLSDAGFDGTSTIFVAGDTNVIIVASLPVQNRPKEKSISLLSELPNGPVAHALATALEGHGFAVEVMGFADDPKQDIISILDLERESPYIANIGSDDYARLKALMTRLHPSGVLWATNACQIRCAEPEYAQILGLARTLRNEMAIDFATLELDDPSSADAMDAICKVYQKFQIRVRDDDVDPDYEYAFANGSVQTSRYHWVSVAEGLIAALSPPEAGAEIPKHLEVGKRGSLKSLQWVEEPPHAKLVGNEVSVEVRAVGMNFKVFSPSSRSIDIC
jgi:hypothetical protein